MEGICGERFAVEGTILITVYVADITRRQRIVAREVADSAIPEVIFQPDCCIRYHVRLRHALLSGRSSNAIAHDESPLHFTRFVVEPPEHADQEGSRAGAAGAPRLASNAMEQRYITFVCLAPGHPQRTANDSTAAYGGVDSHIPLARETDETQRERRTASNFASTIADPLGPNTKMFDLFYAAARDQQKQKSFKAARRCG